MDRSDAHQAITSAGSEQFIATMILVLRSHRHQGGWLTIRQMSQLADTSVRSLQRRLADENVDYTSLVQEARKELAVELMADDTLSINEIAVRLGYTKNTNFSRAFQRWTGKPPMEFRRVQESERGPNIESPMKGSQNA